MTVMYCIVEKVSALEVYEIRRNANPIDGWDVFIGGFYWRSTFTKWGANRLVKKDKGRMKRDQQSR